MPVLTDRSPFPVGEVREVEPDAPKAVVGSTFSFVFTPRPEHHAVLHPDLRAVNVVGWLDYGVLMISAATGSFPMSTVVVMDDTMALGGDPLEFDYPLLSKGRVTVIARKGELPPFEWDF